MNRRLTRLLFLGLAMSAMGAVSLGVSCTDTTGPKLNPDAGAGAGGGGGGATGTGGDLIEEGGVPCNNTCSNDLKKIVDCFGEEISKCGDEQGCVSATCIDNPCEAANQAKSSYGCDYWAVKTGLLDKAEGACFAAFVANTWTTPVNLTVEYDGMPLDVAKFAYIPKGQGSTLQYEPYDAVNGLGVGEVAILFLARNEFGFVNDCPKPAAISTEVGVENTGRGKAFHITTDKPVVAYQILPYGGGMSAFTSATLLLPSSAWGQNYVAINAYKNGTLDMEASPLVDILAKEDGTEVTIVPNTPILGGPDVEPGNVNEKKTYTLNKGEFLQIEQPQELTGSPIQSNKPIGVFGGASCLFIPLNKQACDSAHQMISPVSAMGSEYVGARYRPRMNGAETEIPWRIVGALDGTKLTWVPEDKKPSGAPDMLNNGTIFEFSSPGEFVVKSDADHPFYLAAYMTGGELYNSEGDPEWVNVIPPAQFLDSYVFFADPTYPETTLVVVRTKSKIMGKGFADVTLDCLDKPIEGWIDVGDYQYARVDLMTGNFQNVGNCSSGRHVMSSTLPFGVTVWGWGTKATTTQLGSYAYPAGASVQQINDIIVPAEPK
jgi:hypothetical protein